MSRGNERCGDGERLDGKDFESVHLCDGCKFLAGSEMNELLEFPSLVDPVLFQQIFGNHVE